MQESLGRGRFSVVYGFNEKVAVKIIEIEDQRKPHNFRAELAALNALNGCQNIVSLIKVEEKLKAVEPEVRIYMPRYNYTLEHVIYHFAKSSYPPGSGWRNIMPAEVIKRIASGLARALKACHQHGIIHRDVKPENVLFESMESEPVLVDFGVAWVPSVSEKEEPAGDRETDVSSCEFRAPELLYGLRSYTNKIDMWSLGCVLLRLFTLDCKSLFSPYRSDLGLITAQFETLGKPKLAECPSFQGTSAERVLAGEETSQFSLKLRPIDENLKAKLLPLLSFEPQNRPSASDLLDQLNP